MKRSMPHSLEHSSAMFRRFPSAFIGLMLWATPAAVMAHGGHGNEFHQGGRAATQPTDGIQVDAETASRIGLKVEPISRQPLAFGIQATGQIEVVPSRKVEVTYPVGGTVVRLWVQPGDAVKKGQALAVITSGELAERRVDALDRQAETIGDVREAATNLKLARQTYARQQQIAQTAIQQAQTDLKVAQEQYDRDQELTQQGAIPKRQFLESESRLAEARKALTEAESRLEVLAAEADVQRAEAAVEVAQSRAQLSTATYRTRLNQLGADANPDGTITITAPIAGKVADQEVSLGQAAEDAGAPLMTIVDDGTVLATANIYEKDLNQIAVGQPVRLTVSSLSDRTFQGQITVVGAVVEGENRVVPVKAELDNSDGALKPGMFAELEVVTDSTPDLLLAVPRSALLKVNDKPVVYVQNGSAYQAVEVTLGRSAGNWVEVQSGLFEGDLIVTQRANQLYAQSLRGGGEAAEAADAGIETKETGTPWWMLILGGGAIAASTFAAGWWASRRSVQLLAISPSGYSGSNQPSPNHNGADDSPGYRTSESSSPALVAQSVEEQETPHS